MLRRWTHGHSVAVGLILAVLMARHLWLLLLLVFVLGMVVGRLWFYEAMVADHIRRRWRDRHQLRDLRAWRKQRIPF